MNKKVKPKTSPYLQGGQYKVTKKKKTPAADPCEQRLRLLKQLQVQYRTAVRSELPRVKLAKVAVAKHALTPQQKTFHFQESHSNMEAYIRTRLREDGWRVVDAPEKATLLWSNVEHSNHFVDLKPHQFHNHIKGSHLLTAKNSLHRMCRGKPYYPTSFLIPEDYDAFLAYYEFNRIIGMVGEICGRVKSRVKSRGRGQQQQQQQIKQQQQKQQQGVHQIQYNSKPTTTKHLCLYTLLMEHTHPNEQQKTILKYCLYLQGVRKQKGLGDGVFYHRIQIQKKQQLASQLLQCNDLNVEVVSAEVLSLLLHYHSLFSATVHYSDNSWLVKPCASSRGAGIVLLDSGQFYGMGAGLNYFKYRKTYANKVVQKYLCHPLLLRQPPAFAGRKFDVRQWVVVTHNTSYRYHTAYCRFSAHKYTMGTLKPQVHLTNYSLVDDDTPSVMMLGDLYREEPWLQGEYSRQADSIIADSVGRGLEYDERCFELLGFDFFLDQGGKLWLLEINLNPGCSAQREEKLRVEAERMVRSMLAMVIEGVRGEEWVDVGVGNGVNSRQQEKQGE